MNLDTPCSIRSRNQGISCAQRRGLALTVECERSRKSKLFQRVDAPSMRVVLFVSLALLVYRSIKSKICAVKRGRNSLHGRRLVQERASRLLGDSICERFRRAALNQWVCVSLFHSPILLLPQKLNLWPCWSSLSLSLSLPEAPSLSLQ